MNNFNNQENIDLKWYGYIINFKDYVSDVHGLYSITAGEMVRSGNSLGFVLSIYKEYIQVVFMYVNNLKVDDLVERTKQILNIDVKTNIFSLVVNVSCRIFDQNSEEKYLNAPVERPAPNIMARKSVHEPEYTGIKMVDVLTPIGRGQRQLIIGDRRTGKTSIAFDTILTIHNKY